MTSGATTDPTHSRRERRRREIHVRILDAATELFGRKGFAMTTALEITDAADVAEKTFYNHFPTKQHLIEELAQRELFETGRLLSEARDFPGTTFERLRQFYELSAQRAERGSPDFTREIMFEVMRINHERGEAFEHHGQLAKGIRTLFEDGLARGELARGRDVAFLSELCISAFHGSLNNWMSDPAYPLREWLRQLADAAEQLLGRDGAEDER